MLDLKPRPVTGFPQAQRAHESKQPRKLVLALALLLVAFAGVIGRDRQFWFGDGDVQDSDLAQPEAARQATAKSVPPVVAKAQAAQVQTALAPAAKKPVAAAKVSAESKVAAPKSEDSTTVARTVLPPLDVEVVAGDNHRKVHPGSNATKVELTKPASAVTAKLDAPSNAAQLERMPSATLQPQKAAVTSLPLLAQHMNVQGSVVLKALINADGVIQNLHVLSGPAILSAAAQQAVREWRFKPVLEKGQPVETQAVITVNFTIKVADNAAKTTIAESRPDEIKILSR